MARASNRHLLTQDTHRRVLTVARTLVSEGGWGAAQIAVIAHRSGLATGSFYRYFDSKVDMCAQLLARISDREAEVVRAIIDSDGDATSRLAASVAVFVRRAARAPRLAYAMIAEPCEPAVNQARLQYRQALAEQFARLLSEGIGRGEFIAMREDVSSTCVIGAMMEPLVGLLAREGADPRGEIDALVEQIAGHCVRMVRIPGAKLNSITKTRRPR